MKIKILGIPYQIEEVEHIPETTDTIGLFVAEEQKIYIKKNLPKEIKAQTLLHELVHAMFFQIGEYELGENEKLVQAFSSTLHQFINENDVTSFC